MTMTDLAAFTFVDSDERPDMDSVPPAADVEYPCEVCGRESGPYGGRGRKPKRCPEHKRQKTTAGTRGPGTRGSNVSLAEQATEALWQINGMAAFVAMLAGFPVTAGAIQEREQVFREMCYNALLTDPNMCRFILKGGMQSSKVSLVMCYGMFAAGIAPAFMSEVRERKAAKQAAQEEYENTINMQPGY